MAVGRYYMIYVKRKPASSADDVEKQMDHALDWYRIKPDLWIVWSTSNSEKWYERLTPIVKTGGHVLICELDQNNRQGWMPKEFWDWFQKSR